MLGLGIRKKIRKVKKRIVEDSTWQMAIRKRSGDLLCDGNLAPFTLIKNTYRYWMADPFVITFKGEDYLFAEMFDRKHSKGVIGVSKIKNGKCSKFKVCIDMPFHLSYPNVFEEDGKLFMIPESRGNKSVDIYVCTEFPYKWEKQSTICQGEWVDTTKIVDRNNEYISTDRGNGSKTSDNLYIIKNGKATLLFNSPLKRCGGKMFVHNEKMIRPAQNCQARYGESLIFNTIEYDGEKYGELEILSVGYPSKENKNKEVCVTLNDDNGIVFDGIHTYNFNDNYEVIDLHYSNQAKDYYRLKK